jgi:biuret amidohydrolase
MHWTGVCVDDLPQFSHVRSFACLDDDKKIQGSFYATDLECILQARKIKTIIVCGVTTEVCVHTTVREANDRGYHCIVVTDATASYNDTFHQMALDMVVAQNGIFGSTSSSQSIVEAFEKYMAD